MEDSIDLQAFNNDHPIIVYDGVCILCNGFVQWIIRHDEDGKFRFLSRQSDLGKAFIDSVSTFNDTVYLIYKGQQYQLSDVAIQTSVILGGFWKLLSVAKYIPKGFRDMVYRWIAKNRYKWFGRKDTCIIPDPEIRSRFIDF